MKKIIILVIIFGVIAPNIIFAQKNRVSISTGITHYFFDKTPLFNTNYRLKGKEETTIYDIFNLTLYNSVGIQYKRMLNEKSQLSIEGVSYLETYENVSPNLLKNVYYMRTYGTININYNRLLKLNNEFDFTYGGGVDVRLGSESVAVNYYIIPGKLKEINIETRLMRDVGLNARLGIEYTPLNWLTFYSKLNLIGFIYLNDKNQIKRVRDFYDYDKYPTRLDLSWRFGIGFNFGK